MFWKLLALFTITPLVELTLLIEVGKQIGIWPTVGIVIATGVVGAWLARWTGLQVLGRIRETMMAGGIPTTDLIDGMLVLVSGAMLVTPGVLTDASALLLLTPYGRRIVRGWLKRRFTQAIQQGTITVNIGDHFQDG